MTKQRERLAGTPIVRLDGLAKVTGAAKYAYERPIAGAVYAWPVQATIARGLVRTVDREAALARPGVLAVLDHTNAPRLRPSDEADMYVLQSAEVAFRGQVVALVVATSLETAREAAGAVAVSYDEEPFDAVLDPADPQVYLPYVVNAGYVGSTDKGAVEAAFADAHVSIDATYTTPPEHGAPMEPAATIAAWDGDTLTLYDSTQGPWRVADRLASLFGLPAGAVHVVAEHVGGGFGVKLMPRSAPVLAAMAARAVDRPVKLANTRQQMFTLTGHRTPTVQRVRLAADVDGRLVAVWHDAVVPSSTIHEFVEQAAVPSRLMYATPNLRTTHRVARLNVPTPTWMRAPGRTPGSFALESAMDELAAALGIDPVELRLRNEPVVEPESGLPFSSRSLVACLREGAERFGWRDRDPAPGVRRRGRWLTGTGVAAGAYPVYTQPATAIARAEPDGTYVVKVAGVDIGTGARTALSQLAADELGVPLDRVTVRIGESFARAPGAGGSMGTASWSWAVINACRALLLQVEERAGGVPAEGIEVRVDTGDDVAAMVPRARYAFGAQFAEVEVDIETGELRVERHLGVFAAGRIVNPRTANSQLLGGMIWGISMALHERLEVDPQFGDFANHDFATYHVAANADIRHVEAHVIDEDDDELNPAGVKGIGELPIVGAAAAVANAVYHATGLRVRDLPILIERVRAGLPR
jgi:xanthine dehydrogenase YagR molybdenum-binding subunit